MDLSFQTFVLDCTTLASKIKESNQTYDKILCVARGGLFVGGFLAHLIQIRDVSSMAVRHYTGTEMLDEIIEVSAPCPCPMEGKVLLVDDLVDSGGTIAFIANKYRDKIDFDFAVLYDKGGGPIRPDFFVEEIPKDEWVTFPWEISGD